MATPTYDPIASQTLTSSVSSVTFSSIPTDGTYRDLVLVVQAKPTSGTNAYMETRFNSVNSGYFTVISEGASPFTPSNTVTGTTGLIFVNNTQDFNQTNGGITILNIMNYAQTDKHTSVLARLNNPDLGVLMGAGRWGNTAAVNTIRLELFGTSFASGSTFNLYGVSA